MNTEWSGVVSQLIRVYRSTDEFVFLFSRPRIGYGRVIGSYVCLRTIISFDLNPSFSFFENYYFTHKITGIGGNAMTHAREV